MEFCAFRLAQLDVVVFPPRSRAFGGLAIFNSFDAHMELLRKSWILNNPVPNCLQRNGPLCNMFAP